jgi:hypothetical protein
LQKLDTDFKDLEMADDLDFAHPEAQVCVCVCACMNIYTHIFEDLKMAD